MIHALPFEFNDKVEAIKNVARNGISKGFVSSSIVRLPVASAAILPARATQNAMIHLECLMQQVSVSLALAAYWQAYVYPGVVFL